MENEHPTMLRLVVLCADMPNQHYPLCNTVDFIRFHEPEIDVFFDIHHLLDTPTDVLESTLSYMEKHNISYDTFKHEQLNIKSIINMTNISSKECGIFIFQDTLPIHEFFNIKTLISKLIGEPDQILCLEHHFIPAYAFTLRSKHSLVGVFNNRPELQHHMFISSMVSEPPASHRWVLSDNIIRKQTAVMTISDYINKNSQYKHALSECLKFEKTFEDSYLIENELVDIYFDQNDQLYICRASSKQPSCEHRLTFKNIRYMEFHQSLIDSILITDVSSHNFPTLELKLTRRLYIKGAFNT